MSVAIETSRVEYTGNGATDEFPTTFKFFDSGDLVVEVLPDGGAEEDWELQVEGVDYEVTGAGSASGGTVTFATAPEDDATVRITRVVEFTQLLALSAQGTFSPRSIENQFDKLTMIAQQLNRTDDELLDAIADAREDLLEQLAGLTGSDVGAAFGFLTEQSPLTSGNALQVRFRSNGRYAQVSEHGGDWRALLPGEKVIDLRDCRDGAIGQGIEEHDTEAFQEAFSRLSAALPLTTGAQTGRIYIPKGTYLIGETLEFGGNNSRGIFLFGDVAAGGPDGAVLRYTGDDDGTLIHFYGLCSSVIQDIAFDLNSKAKRGIWLESFQASGGGGSTQNRIIRCRFGSLYDSESAHIVMGADSGPQYQVDQVTVQECIFSGNSTRMGTAVQQLQGGNVKNLSVLGGVMTYLEKCIESGGSGYTLWERTVCSEIDVMFTIGGACVAKIDSVQIEGCKKFVDYAVSQNPGKLTLINNQVYYDTEDADDDVGVDAQCCLTMIGNHFYNEGDVAPWVGSTDHATPGIRRQNDSGKVYELITAGTTASSGGPTGTAKRIPDNTAVWKYVGPVASDGTGRRSKVAAGGTINQACLSFGNFFRDTLLEPWAPIYDGSNNNLLGSDEVNAYAQVTTLGVYSIGDCGGPMEGSPLVRAYLPCFGAMINSNLGMMATPHPDGTILGLGELHVGLNRLELTKADFSAAATTKTLAVGQTQGDCFIQKTLLKVTEVFAGVTTPTLKLGTTNGGDEVIPSTTAAATEIIGKKVGDVSTGVGDLWEAAELAPDGTRHVPSGTYFYVTLASVAGNLSALTTGKVVVIIEVARIG